MTEMTERERLAAQHASQLRRAIAGRPDRRTLAMDVTGRSYRTVGNWISEKKPTLPSEAEREALRKAFPGYDATGDAVEIAVEQSPLDTWRKRAVVSEYQRHLHEQEREAAG